MRLEVSGETFYIVIDRWVTDLGFTVGEWEKTLWTDSSGLRVLSNLEVGRSNTNGLAVSGRTVYISRGK